MSCLICGSIAFDTIMTFDGYFREQILPEQIHILNVSFTVPALRREFGGCAGNIAYSLKLIGGDPVLMGTVGQDGTPYLERFRTLGINYKHVRQIPDLFTAQAIITTDKDNNQITAFHPGALAQSHLNQITADNTQGIKLCIIAPDSKITMMQHARACAELKLPFIFDPGQMIGTFSSDELREMLDLASYLAVNDYEAKVIEAKINTPLKELAQYVQALIVTQGESGSTIIANNVTHHIPPVPVQTALDPTGCGDAYRAGLLFGITQGLDWPTTGRLASLLGALKVEYRGPQNHQLPVSHIVDHFAEIFDYRF